jgi:hypothetical protein
MLVGAFFDAQLPARPRVQRAPGLPRALYLRGQGIFQILGRFGAAGGKTVSALL